MDSLLAGFTLGLTLIVAIGAQNAFVLRQGLARRHVGVVVAFCAFADALLMTAGVAGLAALIGQAPRLAQALAALGIAFLVAYGVRALRRAARPGALVAGGGAAGSRAQALAQAAGFTFLNPHVYLDTVLLVGSVGAAQAARGAFIAGAVGSSVLWFVSLGYGARLLAPWFARPRAWRLLDAAIGLTMLALAASLLPMAAPSTFAPKMAG